MSAVEQAQASGGLFGFLDRNRTIAKPGFSRWMVPPAALCIHLCIGQAYAFSVFNLPMTKLIGITQSAPGDWKLTELGWIFTIAIFVARHLCRDIRPLGRGRRPAPGDVRRRPVLGRRVLHLGGRRLIHTLWIVYFGYGFFGGLRSRPWLHLAGLDPDQMVPRPSGNGDRHGDHGIRRRRVYRRAALGLVDERFPTPTHVGVAQTFIGHRRDLLRLHDGRRVRSCACRRRAGGRKAIRHRRSRVEADHQK